MKEVKIQTESGGVETLKTFFPFEQGEERFIATKGNCKVLEVNELNERS